jgi:hypothetical protein
MKLVQCFRKNVNIKLINLIMKSSFYKKAYKKKFIFHAWKSLEWIYKICTLQICCLLLILTLQNLKILIVVDLVTVLCWIGPSNFIRLMIFFFYYTYWKRFNNLRSLVWNKFMGLKKIGENGKIIKRLFTSS